MSISPAGMYNPRPQQNVGLDFQDLRRKAQLFSKQDDDLYRYIVKIICDGDFQADPKGYMSKWEITRADSEEFREIPDNAFDFLMKNV